MCALRILLAALQTGGLVHRVNDGVHLVLGHLPLKLLVAAAKADLALGQAVVAVVQARAAPEQQAVVVQGGAGAAKVGEHVALGRVGADLLALLRTLHPFQVLDQVVLVTLASLHHQAGLRGERWSRQGTVGDQ